MALRGTIQLTVQTLTSSEEPAVTGSVLARWTTRSTGRFADGSRSEDESRGELTGGQLLPDPAAAAADEPHLVWHGAEWGPPAVGGLSFSFTTYGPDGRFLVHGDGIVERRAADPVPVVIEMLDCLTATGNVDPAHLWPPMSGQ